MYVTKRVEDPGKLIFGVEIAFGGEVQNYQNGIFDLDLENEVKNRGPKISIGIAWFRCPAPPIDRLLITVLTHGRILLVIADWVFYRILTLMTFNWWGRCKTTEHSPYSAFWWCQFVAELAVRVGIGVSATGDAGDMSPAMLTLRREGGEGIEGEGSLSSAASAPPPTLKG